MNDAIEPLQHAVAGCRTCAAFLPFPPRPLAVFSATARIVITGQAPGRLAHESGIAWNDPSGNRLRDWMGLDAETFYDPARVAFVPMGFCFPGTGKSGDLPPRRECAPQWHARIADVLPAERLTLLVGSYAQAAYSSRIGKGSLEQRIRDNAGGAGGFFALPHPSWRVSGWIKRNPWFELEILPVLRTRVQAALGPGDD